MSDMGRPEYITSEWIEDMKYAAADKRRQAEILEAEAKAIDSMRMGFEQRLRDHKKWSEKTVPA